MNDESKQTWMIAITRLVPLLSSYKSHEKTDNLSAGEFGESLQYFTGLSFQQRKIWSQSSKILLLSVLFNERNIANIEPTVIKEANQFFSFNFGNIQLLDIMNFPRGAKSLDSFLKESKTSARKGFSRYK